MLYHCLHPQQGHMFSQDGKINANVLLKQVLTCKKGLAPRDYRVAGTVWIVASQLPEF